MYRSGRSSSPTPSSTLLVRSHIFLPLSFIIEQNSRTGFMNALLFLFTIQILPDLSELPSFETPRSGRKKLILSESRLSGEHRFSYDEKEIVNNILTNGISPFTLPPAMAHLDR